MLGPLLNGDLMPPDEEKVDGNTWGLYFARGASILERKKFPSYLRLRSHSRFIAVEDGFGCDTFGDHIYKIKVIVDDRRYFVAGTYDQSSRECNMALQFYGCSEKLKGDLVIFSLSRYQPERFLEAFPRFKNAEKKQEIKLWFVTWSNRYKIRTQQTYYLKDGFSPSRLVVILWNSRFLSGITGIEEDSEEYSVLLLYSLADIPSQSVLRKVLDLTPDWLDELENRYTLKQSLQTDWDSLERNMRAFLRGCMKVNRLNIPEDFRLWLYPNFYMYHAVWETEVDARRAAMHSQSKWVDIVAQVSRVPYQEPSAFLSKRQQEYERLHQEPAPSKWEWQQHLQRETSIAPEWLAYFHQIMDIPMVGTYLDVHNSGCFPWLPVFLEAKMPLMLFWGTVDHWSIPKRLTFLLPTPNTAMFPIPSAAVISTLVKAQKPWPPPLSSLEENLSYEAGSSEARVQLPRITGGLPCPNEDLFAFIKRRDERRLKAIATKTTLQHQSHLQHEDNARRDRPPGRKGARVYYWDLVEGTRVRTAVGRSNYEDIWDRYGSHQQRYDSVADEWDICTDLDPHDGPDHDDLDSDDDYDAYFMSVNSEMNEEGDHNVGAASSDAFLIRLHRSNDLPPASIQFLEPIEDTAYHQFGFLKQPMQDGRELIISPKIWMKTLGLLGHGRPPHPQGPDDQTKLQLSATDIHSRPPIPFEVDTVSSYNGVWFLIQAREARDNEAFSIGLRSAATVMEIARRRWGPRTEDILKCLINEGMSFNIRKKGEKLSGSCGRLYKVVQP
ncbi:hypothetical protein DFH05DRAFT_1459074 [Lentinula detonsa]|uniref:Uncharacterized protein n=1 Tax=Lentinula detonsa TaxID=2804962 RepID=A0A9W8P1N9_9AGAR|nr:hypothetical protein DFH05DRAFT_1459074 [Lentinula detonsa]